MRDRNEFDFRYALDAVKNCGLRIRRREWPDCMFLFLHAAIDPRPHSFRDQGYVVSIDPFLCVRSADGKFTPWSPPQADLLANDWSVVQ